MLLYKYRSFDALEHLLDILVHERLYCPHYFELNDPFEGMFQHVFYVGKNGGGPFNLIGPHTKQVSPGSVKDLLYSANQTRVCSLSSDVADVRLWSLYAGGHSGVAIEIDFSGLENEIHEVTYAPQLEEHSIGLLSSPTAAEILSKKTHHWHYESEYRVIGEQPYFPVKGRIRRVLFGIRAAQERMDLLKQVVNGWYPIERVRLNVKTTKVET